MRGLVIVLIMLAIFAVMKFMNFTDKAAKIADNYESPKKIIGSLFRRK